MSASSRPAKSAPRKPPKQKTPAADEEDKYSDRLLGEVNLAGAPAMYELHQLSRRKRAQFTAVVVDLLPQAERLIALMNKSNAANLGLSETAEMMALLADLEDMLAAIAVDSDALRAWAREADDTAILALIMRFVEANNSGEAPSSSI